MKYSKPEIHELGLAENVIQGSIGGGTDNAEYLPVDLTLEDFE